MANTAKRLELVTSKDGAVWVSVRLILKSLILYLEDEVELIAKIEAMGIPGGETDWCKNNPDDVMVIAVFRDAYQVLIGLDYPIQARRIIETYANTSEFASDTLEYVTLLLEDLKPEGARI